MELQELQARVDQWIKEYGVRYFNELTNTAILMEEVGELARVWLVNTVSNPLKKEKEKTWQTKWLTSYGFSPALQIKPGWI